MNRRSPLPAAAVLGFAALGALLAAPPPARAQLALSSLLQSQGGNVPYTAPLNRTDLYGQLQVDASYGATRFGGRFEFRENSERLLTYREVTQRWAEWSDAHLRARVGNVYTLIGRGLVQRAFELPGVVIDQPGTRSEFGFSRDLDGALLDGRWGPLEARAFGGTPNGGTVSASPDETLARYDGQLVGGQLALAGGRGARAGAGYLRTSVVDALASVDRQEEFGTGFVEFDALRLAGARAVRLPVYAEYAQRNRSFGQWWSFARGDRAPHALFAGGNLLAGPLAVSAEFKDYRNFRTGVNDPPSLVREHGFALLNRATHVLEAESEHGVQLEGSWSDPDGVTLTANHARADGTPAGTARRFEENYFELRLAPARGPAAEATLYVDRGQDTFSSIATRQGWGGSASAHLPRDVSVELELERSDATRFFSARSRRAPVAYTDERAAITVERAGWGSLGMVGERSSDPALRSDKRPLAHRRFFAVTASARLGERHRATLLVGERRGGRACTAGTCYEVQDFRGAELRLTSRY